MKSSTDRILTTHTGSLPRSKALSAMLVKREQRKPYDTTAFQAEIERNLDANVRRQIESGVDIGNDGETPRVGFSTYTTERMTGFGGESRRKPTLDAIKFPGFAEYMSRQIGVAEDLAKVWNAPQAVGKLEYDSTLKEAKEETSLFQSSLKRLGVLPNPRASEWRFKTIRPNRAPASTLARCSAARLNEGVGLDSFVTQANVSATLSAASMTSAVRPLRSASRPVSPSSSGWLWTRKR